MVSGLILFQRSRKSKSTSLAGNGSIEFPEFLILIANKLRTEDMREEIRNAFRVFDRNSDGRLNAKELRDVLQTVGDKMSEDDIDELIAAADANGDGVIDYEGQDEKFNE